MKTIEAVQERRVRTLAARLGCHVMKSRQQIALNNRGNYQLVNDRSFVVLDENSTPRLIRSKGFFERPKVELRPNIYQPEKAEALLDNDRRKALLHPEPKAIVKPEPPTQVPKAEGTG